MSLEGYRQKNGITINEGED